MLMETVGGIISPIVLASPPLHATKIFRSHLSSDEVNQLCCDFAGRDTVLPAATTQEIQVTGLSDWHMDPNYQPKKGDTGVPGEDFAPGGPVRCPFRCLEVALWVFLLCVFRFFF